MKFFCGLSHGAANISTYSIFMDETMGFRSMAGLFSVSMPVKSGFLGFGCMMASGFGMNAT